MKVEKIYMKPSSLTEQLKRLRMDIPHEYFKITNFANGKKLAENFKALKDKKLVALSLQFCRHAFTC